MITFIDSGRLFVLQAERFAYVMAVHPAGHLCHVHAGRPIKADPILATLVQRPQIAFSAEQVLPNGSRIGLDVLGYEFPTANTGDFRLPAIDIRHADGTRGLRLQYQNHRITGGKPPLSGLPATYAEAEDNVETLEIDLIDQPSEVLVTLSYSVFAKRSVVTRSTRVTNQGRAACTLLRCASASIDVANAQFDLMHLPGAWARERWIERQPLHSGLQAFTSRRGTSSHQHNPFFALVGPATDEDRGTALGFSLVYSGNHFCGVEVDQQTTARAFMGIDPESFSWQLDPQSSFQTPEAILCFSDEGLGRMSQQYHSLFRERLVRGPWRDDVRPILINNWETTYFEFDEARLVAIAEAASPSGVELFVLDDGWFGRRNGTNSLGDWFADARKLPGGLESLGARITTLGMRFGLWIEPEMVSRDSDLYRAHPDWCLHLPGRDRTEGRMQLVLDFSRPEIVAAIYEQIAHILRTAPVSYVKWDMNRSLTEIGSAPLGPNRQDETAHRYVLGVYAFMERITREFPNVLFEACSGGGGRFDPGMLFYMPQIWCSDNSDAIARARIQFGTSLIYPACAMAAHMTVVPNHQMGRVTPLKTRAHVALAGQFGLELDLSKCTHAEREALAEYVALGKRTRHLLREGTHYRLADPFKGNLAAWMLVGPRRDEAIVTAVLTLAEPDWRPRRLKLKGLDPHDHYRDLAGPDGPWPGDFLMEIGLPIQLIKDFTSELWHLVRA